MKTIHVISHTHWDREWYQPFQVFRLRLVQLVDKVISILGTNSEFKRFMLDGQTIVLEDYLELRPEKESILRQFISEGRILIGPWYVLPDEFLVSPEAHIRNLLKGKAICEHYGQRMMIGYIPDPFGHIGQMPQILKGFGISKACFRRGLADEPVVLLWQSRDGSEVLTSYLRDGYDNAAWLPLNDPDLFIDKSLTVVQSLSEHSISNNLLFMHGTDHMFPGVNLVPCMQEFNEKMLLTHQMIHSTLPEYFESLAKDVNKDDAKIPVVIGELRECKRHELLPGVLSARMWIKQRNHYCENLLERWIEPFSAMCFDNTTPDCDFFHEQKPIIDYCWKLLLQNHPHDSICGCSIDDVHNEMALRFDQVEQVASVLLDNYFSEISAAIDHSVHTNQNEIPVVVFNASPYNQSNLVEIEVPLPAGYRSVAVVDTENHPIRSDIKYSEAETLFEFNFDRDTLQSSLSAIQDGTISGYSIIDAAFTSENGRVEIHLVLNKSGAPCVEKFDQLQKTILSFLSNKDILEYHIIATTSNKAIIRFIPADVPGLGYKTFKIVPGRKINARKKLPSNGKIENEFYSVRVEKEKNCFVVLDKMTQREYSNIHTFVDSGDVGDEYNFNPPEEDRECEAVIVEYSVDQNEIEQTIHVNYDLNIPVSAAEDRKRRSEHMTTCPIRTTVRLIQGINRIDFATEVDNRAKDHRLRVTFSACDSVDTYFTDNHFEISKRTIEIPQGVSNWVEQPRPEVPQRLFTVVHQKNCGIMLINKGLPEVQVLSKGAKSEIALTLMRCVGWLSRDDLSLRPRGAGPLYQTPGAQMLGVYSFEYSIVTVGEGWQQEIPNALNYDIGLKILQDRPHKGTRSSSLSMFSVENINLLVTASKVSEDGNGVILRGYNPLDSVQTSSIVANLDCTRADLVNLDESPIQQLPLIDQKTNITVQPFQIFSIKFTKRQDG